MRIKLREVDVLKSNPKGFRDYQQAIAATPFRFSKRQALHYSAFAYHRFGDDIARALNHFDHMFLKNFKDNKTHEAYYEALIAYHEAYQSVEFDCIQCMYKFAMPIAGAHHLTGRIPRIDIAPHAGYAVWMFDEDPLKWRSSLASPLLQYYVSNLFKCEIEDVTVGNYDFATADYAWHSYSQSEVDDSIVTLQSLLINISAEAGSS